MLKMGTGLRRMGRLKGMKVYELRECTPAEAARLIQAPYWVGLYGITKGEDALIVCARTRRAT